MRILRKKGKFAQKRERKTLWRGMVTGIAAIVVFCTTYALILPAITMETQGFSCGLTEHKHSQDCYQLICGKQEYFSHSHSDECYEGGSLVCTLTERTIHHHSDDCYSKPEYSCSLTESQGHTHSEDCYTTERSLVCGQSECEAHTHSDGCYTEEVIPCNLEETQGHTHSEECYTDGELTCGMEETQGHSHSEACTGTKQVLTCTLAETPGHSHGDSCYEEHQVLACGKEESEGHTHSDICYPADFQPQLICGQEDIPEHRHSQDCCARICELEEHTHTELCVDSHEGFLENQNEILNNDEKKTDSDEDSSEEENQTPENSQKQASDEEEEKKQTNSDDEKQGNKENENDSSDGDLEDRFLICDDLEHEHDDNCYVDTEEEYLSILMSMPPVQLFAASRTIDETYVADLNQYLSSASASTPVYNPETDSFESSFEFDFTISNGEAGLNAYNYQFLLKNILVPDKLLNTDRALYDMGGEQRGTYRYTYDASTGAYYAVLNFYHDYVNTSKEITGYVKLNGSFGNTAYTKDDGINVQYTDNISLSFSPEQIKFPDGARDFDLCSSKTGSYTYNEVEKKLTYTVLLYSTKSTPSPLSYEDTMNPNGLPIDSTNASVSVQIGDYTASESGAEITNLVSYDGEGKPAFTVTADGKIVSSTNTLPGLAAQKCYVLTYEYPIGEIEALDYNFSPTNVVNASGKSGNQEVRTNSQYNNINISNSYSLTKAGEFAADRINWTITVNSGNLNIAGMDLSDEMFSQAIGNTMTVNPPNTVEWRDGKLVFLADENGENTNSYEIKFSTSVSPQWNEQSQTNTVTLSKDNKPIKEPVISEPVPYSAGSIEKFLDGYTQYSQTAPYITMNWRVDLIVPSGGIARNTRVTEWTDKTNGGSNHVIDPNSVVLKWNDDTALIKGVDYSISMYEYSNHIDNNSSASSTEPNHYMVVTFLKDIIPTAGQTKLHMTYSSTATETVTENDGEKTVQFRNKATSEGKSGEASLDYTFPVIPGAWKKDGNDQTGESNAQDNGKMTWKIVVKTGGLSETKTITVKDTLPENVTLDSSESEYLTVTDPSWKLHTIPVGENGSISYTGKDYNGNDVYRFEGTYQGQSLVLSISRFDNTAFPANQWFTVTCKCIIDEAFMNSTAAGSDPISFTNTANVEFDGTQINAETLSQTQKWQKKQQTPETEKHISKKGARDLDGMRIDYTVYINNGTQTAIPGDTLTVTDTLTYQRGPNMVDYYLLPAQVKLIDLTTKEPVPDGDWTWTSSDNADAKPGEWDQVEKIIEATVPNKPLKLTYAYKFVVNKPGDGNTAELHQVNNKVELSGVDNENVSYKVDYLNWQASGTEAGVSAPNSFSLTKVDESNSGLLLGDAVFKTEQYAKNAETQQWKWSDYDKTYTTDKTYGMITVKKDDGYAFNTLYKVYEASPPDGYSYIDGAVPAYYFYFKSTDDDVIPGTSNLPDASFLKSIKAIDLMTNSGSSTLVKNRKLPTTSISLRKTWKDGCCPSTGVNVTFNLYRVPEGTAFDIDNLGELQPVRTVTHEFTATAADWSYTFENLPTQNSSGVDWVYFIKEEEVPSFVPVYTNNSGIKSGEISIVNEKTITYELPNTGGMGTEVYTVTGLAVSIGAVLALMKKRKKGERE